MDLNDTPEPFERATVEALREALTMLDIYRARKLTKETVEVGLEAYHQAALRLGVIAPDATLEDFLQRLRADDFNEIMGAKPTAPLVSGGGSEEHSSVGMATPRENS